MVVILRKDDGFTRLLAVTNTDAVCHVDVQCLTNGVLIEKPVVKSGCCNAVGKLAIFGNKGFLIGSFVLLAQFFIGILINFVFGRGSKSHRRRVKTDKYITVFVIDRTVRLIADE